MLSSSSDESLKVDYFCSSDQSLTVTSDAYPMICSDLIDYI